MACAAVPLGEVLGGTGKAAIDDDAQLESPSRSRAAMTCRTVSLEML